MASQNKNLVIVFAKPPVPGKAKTRLIPALGEQGSANFHAHLVRQTLKNVCDSDLWQVQLWAANQSMPEFFNLCANEYSLEIHYQQGSDLGERMFHAISESLRQYEKVCLIGTDCPGIDKKLISYTLQQLDTADLLVTPAEDGGYVQIAARTIKPEVFSNVVWGSNRVMQKTLQNIEQTKLSGIITEPLWDIDIPKDLERYKKEYQAFANVLPLT